MTYYARSIIVAYCILGGCFLLGCGLTHGVCGAAATIDHPMTLTSTAFHNHARMPKRFTADGRDISPQLKSRKCLYINPGRRGHFRACGQDHRCCKSDP